MAAPPELRLVYANTNHSALGNTQALAAANDFTADVLALAEPHLRGGRVVSTSWLQFAKESAVLLVRPSLASVTKEVACPLPEAVCCSVQNITIVAVYLSPNVDATAAISGLQTFLASITGPLCVVGDFNATTALIPGNVTNQRGEALEDVIAACDLEVANPPTPTWQRQHHAPRTLDYCLLRHIAGADCVVRDDLDSCSDHHHMQIRLPAASALPPPPAATHLDKEELDRLIRSLPMPERAPLESEEAIDGVILTVTELLQGAVREATREHRPQPTSLHWWQPELATYRRALNRIRRQLQKNPADLLSTILLLLRKHIRRRFKKAMLDAKQEAWRVFITQERAWGKPYRVLCKKKSSTKGFPLIRRPDGSLCGTAEEAYAYLLSTKFPSTPSLHWAFSYAHPLHAGPPNRVTAEQLATVIKTLDNRKAPGPDGINNGTIKLFHRHHPQFLAHVFTACLSLGYFPKPWKVGRVVFIPKPDKDVTLPDGNRPITLLCGFGKLLEVVLNTELVDHLEEEGLLHADQFGFRRHRGTEDAVHDALEKIAATRERHWYTAAISFDIKGAFDNASWSAILQSPVLAEAPGYIRRCLRSYFEDRFVTCNGVERQLYRGCPQGSVLGPTLWNIVHDSVIRGLSPDYPGVTCYADDTLVVVGAADKLSLAAECMLCVCRTVSLVAINGLELNSTKTEILVFVDAPARNQIHEPTLHGWQTIRYQGRELKTCRSIRYLGVMLDNDGRWDTHVKRAVSRASAALVPISALCRRTFGYSNTARRVMVDGAVYTHLLYCSSVYYHRLASGPVQRLICGLQRRGDIMGTRAYSTTSGPAAAVLQGRTPLDLRIIRRSIRWLITHRRAVPYWGPYTPITAWPPPKTWDRAALDEWERRWYAASTGAWTKQLFPTISQRLRTEIGPIDFWLAQGLTGHGVFGEFLHRFKRRDDPSCPCGAEEQTVSHVFRHCLLYTEGRPIVWQPVGAEHFDYMRATVRALWEVENPGHSLTPVPTTETQTRQPRVPARRERVPDAVQPP